VNGDWMSCRLLGGNGTWRSLAAHLTGGQGVAGSNPAVPTIAWQVRGHLADSARWPQDLLTAR
jgi:hypothetical protein